MMAFKQRDVATLFPQEQFSWLARAIYSALPDGIDRRDIDPAGAARAIALGCLLASTIWIALYMLVQGF